MSQDTPQREGNPPTESTQPAAEYHQVCPCCGSHLGQLWALTLHLWDKARDPAVSLPSARCTNSADHGCSSVGSWRALLFVPTCVSPALASTDLGKGLGLGLVISSTGIWKVITKLREKALLTRPSVLALLAQAVLQG